MALYRYLAQWLPPEVSHREPSKFFLTSDSINLNGLLACLACPLFECVQFEQANG